MNICQQLKATKKMQLSILKDMIKYLEIKSENNQIANTYIENELQQLQELDLVKDFLFAGWFAENFINFNENTIFEISGANSSFVAYMLGITQTNSIKNNLIFETRFNMCNKGRFVYYMSKTKCEEIVLCLKDIFDNVQIKENWNGTSCLIIIEGIDFEIITYITPIENMPVQSNTEVSSLYTYEEEYFRTLHYIAGFSNREIAYLLHCIREDKTEEVINFQNRFCNNAKHLSRKESNALFTKLTSPTEDVETKAIKLQVDYIMDKLLPF